MINIYNVARKHFSSWFGPCVQTLLTLVYTVMTSEMPTIPATRTRVSWKLRRKSDASFPLEAFDAGQKPILLQNSRNNAI
jgi:hypothetical protein